MKGSAFPKTQFDILGLLFSYLSDLPRQELTQVLDAAVESFERPTFWAR